MTHRRVVVVLTNPNLYSQLQNEFDNDTSFCFYATT